MGFSCKPSYTEHQVSKLLKSSEDASTGDRDRGAGHSEGLHELRAVGKGRASTSLSAIEERIVGEEKKTKSGAFDGCQAAAVAFALNSKAGQTALGYLAIKEAQHVFVRVNIEAGNFRAVNMSTTDVTPVSNVDFVVAPSGVTLGGFLNANSASAGGIAMKLMKTPGGDLHIRTAFPLNDPPARQTCQITYSGYVCNQELPA